MLPYTAEALFAQFAQYNQAYWPGAVIAGGLALAVLFLVIRPRAWSGRLVAVLLAAAWLWVGVVYHLFTFATLNFAAPAYGGLFILQGGLLGWTGAIRCRLAFRPHRDLIGWAGLGLAAAALILYPVVDWLAGSDWWGVRATAVAPDPTAVFTLGLLLMLDGRVPWHLAAVPVFWIVVAGVTGWVLAIPQDIALLVVGLVALGLIIEKNRLFGRS